MNVKLFLRVITVMLIAAVAFLGTVAELSAQDTDGMAEGARRDGFNWGWLGLLGLLGLLPRKPIEERQNHTTTRPL